MRVVETRNNIEEIKEINNIMSFRIQLTVLAIICSQTNTHVVHSYMPAHTPDVYFINSTSVLSFIVCPEKSSNLKHYSNYSLSIDSGIRYWGKGLKDQRSREAASPSYLLCSFLPPNRKPDPFLPCLTISCPICLPKPLWLILVG